MLSAGFEPAVLANELPRRFLGRADGMSIGFLPNLVRLSVIVKPGQCEGSGLVGAVAPWEKQKRKNVRVTLRPILGERLVMLRDKWS